MLAQWNDMMLLLLCFCFCFRFHACQSLCVVRLRSTLLRQCVVYQFMCHSRVRLYSYFWFWSRHFALCRTQLFYVDRQLCRLYFAACFIICIPEMNSVVHLRLDVIIFLVRAFIFILSEFFFSFLHRKSACEFEKPINVIILLVHECNTWLVSSSQI